MKLKNKKFQLSKINNQEIISSKYSNKVDFLMIQHMKFLAIRKKDKLMTD